MKRRCGGRHETDGKKSRRTTLDDLASVEFQKQFNEGYRRSMERSRRFLKESYKRSMKWLD